jgi:hypothetical protein
VINIYIKEEISWQSYTPEMREGRRGRERKKDRWKESERDRKRERWKERERDGKRERERVRQLTAKP